MPSYERPDEGEWVQPVLENYKLSCCDCGLVHRMNFRVEDGRPQFQAFRDNRATGQVRRHRSWLTPEEHADRVIANYLCLVQLPENVKRSIAKRIAFEVHAYGTWMSRKRINEAREG